MRASACGGGRLNATSVVCGPQLKGKTQKLIRENTLLRGELSEIDAMLVKAGESDAGTLP